MEMRSQVTNVEETQTGYTITVDDEAIFSVQMVAGMPKIRAVSLERTQEQEVTAVDYYTEELR